MRSSMFPPREVVEAKRSQYLGRRVRFLGHGHHDPQPLETGLLGVVDSVDDIGTLHMKWANGRTLGLTEGDRFELVRPMPDRGTVSPRFGHLGMWTLSLGPNSPVPGQRLELALLNHNGDIVRRFEQIRGACTDPGYVDFFLSHNCRPVSHLYPIVDIGADGKMAGIICENYTQSMGMDLYLQLMTTWVTANGKPEWAIPSTARAGEVLVV